MNWKPGDKARVRRNITCDTGLEFVLGREVTLIGKCDRDKGHWYIDIKVPSATVSVAEDALEPILPLGSWSELALACGFDIRTRKVVEVGA